MTTPDVPTGDEQFAAPAEDGDDEPTKKGTAGTDAQSRRRKGLEDEAEDDELTKKGTAGTDAQSRRRKG